MRSKTWTSVNGRGCATTRGEGRIKIICDENSGWIVYSVYDQSGIREEFCVAALVGRSVNADSKVGFFWCVSEQAQFGQFAQGDRQFVLDV